MDRTKGEVSQRGWDRVLKVAPGVLVQVKQRQAFQGRAKPQNPGDNS